MINHYKGAILDYNYCIIYDGNNYSNYYNRGFAKYLIEEYTGSIIDLSKAI